MTEASETEPTPFTLRAASGLSPDPAPLAESTLVIIDAQQEYGASGLLPLEGLEAALAQTALLLERARLLACPVIHVVHDGSAGGAFDPAVGGRVRTEVEPRASEVIVRKGLPNAFAGTDLLEHLGTSEIRPPLVIAGFMTHMCVSSTARAALDLGFDTTVVADATATRSLPGSDGSSVIAADVVHRSALAALADRFSVVTTTPALLG